MSMNPFKTTTSAMIIAAVLTLLRPGPCPAFTVLFDLNDEIKVERSLRELEKGREKGQIIHEIRKDKNEGKISVVFSDHHFEEVTRALQGEFPLQIRSLQDRQGQLFNFSPRIKATERDYLEAVIRSNVFPHYGDLVRHLTEKTVLEEMQSIEDEKGPSRRAVRLNCHPAYDRDFEEFLYFGRKVSEAINKKIVEGQGEGLKEGKDLVLFILGGSLESFYHYLKTKGTSLVPTSNIEHMPISRDLFRGHYEETKAYLGRLITPHLRQGKQVLLFDTLYRGESMLTFQKMLGELREKSPDLGWEQVVLMGAPEKSWEDLRHFALIEREVSLKKHRSNPKSFYEVKVPTPGSVTEIPTVNGTKYVFAENPQFVRGKYKAFSNGTPLNEWLYPERLGREVPPTPLAISTYRYKKLAAILLMLKLQHK